MTYYFDLSTFSEIGVFSTLRLIIYESSHSLERIKTKHICKLFSHFIFFKDASAGFIEMRDNYHHKKILSTLMLFQKHILIHKNWFLIICKISKFIIYNWDSVDIEIWYDFSVWFNTSSSFYLRRTTTLKLADWSKEKLTRPVLDVKKGAVSDRCSSDRSSFSKNYK